MKNQQAENSRGGPSNTYALINLHRHRMESNTYEDFPARAAQGLAGDEGRALRGYAKSEHIVIEGR